MKNPETVIINLPARRATKDVAPRWFDWPFCQAYRKATLSSGSSPYLLVDVIKEIVQSRSKVILLVFNPSVFTILTALLIPPALLEVHSLYQWIWTRNRRLHYLGILYILKRSSRVYLYDRNTETKLASKSWLKQKLLRYPIYTDTDFFRYREPQNTVEGLGSIILVVGDHKRDDSILNEVASMLPEMQVIRISKHLNNIAPVKNLKVLTSVPYEELQLLYRNSAACMVITTETGFPVGITALAEAIACGCAVVATKGAGTGFFKETSCTRFVEVGATADEIVDQLRSAMRCQEDQRKRSNLKWLSGEECVRVLTTK